MSDHIQTLKAMKNGLMECPDGFKQAMSYAALSKHTGIPERQLIRWMTEKNSISPAWSALLALKFGDQS
jgi:hypothetical protein